MKRHSYLPSLRAVFAAAIVTLGFASSGQAVTPSGERLKNLADASDLWFGSALNHYLFWVPDTPNYLALMDAESNLFTPEGAMKFVAVEATQNVFTFNDADTIVNHAVSVGADVHGHCLLWYYNNPTWVTTGSWTPATLTAAMYNHIDKVMGRYAGKIAAWDVVNEAIDGNKSSPTWQNNLRVDPWSSGIGTNYIELAFQRARLADPSALLVYNDYNQEQTNAKSNTMYAMVVDFQNRGIPLDGVGFQCHWGTATPNYPDFASNLDRFAKRGLKIFLSEFDTDNTTGTLGTVPSLSNDAQGRIYYNVLDKALRCPAVVAFQTWGLTDKYSWIGANHFPVPFDQNYVAKPAYYALQDGFSHQFRADLTTNGGFETGAVSPWTNNGGGTLSIVNTAAHSGTYAVQIASRGASSNGPALDVTSGLIAQGSGRYFISAWAKFATGSGTVRATLRTIDDAGTHYRTIDQAVGAGWTQVSGWTNVAWFKNLTNATLYFETPGSTASFQVDDVRIGDGNVLSNGNFENALAGWTGLGGAAISATTASAEYHYGASGVATKTRAYSSSAPTQNILATLQAYGPGNYYVEGYMKLTTGTSTAKITLRLTYGGVDHYIVGATTAINSTGWTKVAFATPVSVTWTGALTGAIVYIETPGNVSNLFVDDLWMRK